MRGFSVVGHPATPAVRVGFSIALMRLLVLACVVFSLVGCQRFKAVMSDDDGVDYQPPALDYSQPAATSGGLFRAGHTGSLLQDKRALRVGDILTIVLDESTQSSKSAGTSYGKSSDVSVGVPTVFGSTMPDLESAISAARPKLPAKYFAGCNCSDCASGHAQWHLVGQRGKSPEAEPGR
jgi:hypothetical protein